MFSPSGVNPEMESLLTFQKRTYTRKSPTSVTTDATNGCAGRHHVTAVANGTEDIVELVVLLVPRRCCINKRVWHVCADADPLRAKY